MILGARTDCHGGVERLDPDTHDIGVILPARSHRKILQSDFHAEGRSSQEGTRHDAMAPDEPAVDINGG
jgi:hypothetical protein